MRLLLAVLGLSAPILARSFLCATSSPTTTTTTTLLTAWTVLHRGFLSVPLRALLASTETELGIACLPFATDGLFLARALFARLPEIAPRSLIVIVQEVQIGQLAFAELFDVAQCFASLFFAFFRRLSLDQFADASLFAQLPHTFRLRNAFLLVEQHLADALHVLVRFGHLGEVIIRALRGNAQIVKPLDTLDGGRLCLTVEQDLTLEIIQHRVDFGCDVWDLAVAFELVLTLLLMLLDLDGQLGCEWGQVVHQIHTLDPGRLQHACFQSRFQLRCVVDRLVFLRLDHIQPRFQLVLSECLT
uniref:Putative secreted peptide n=1 Tax=Anopheles braziliensis TaxID=58242 RepID=A0A2M3ZMM4_9DIPT